jgi:site-specific recombinase XerC
MAEFWRTKAFKVLSVQWNRKLDDSGFKDAETDLKGERGLKQRATNSYRQATQLERETRLEYYCFLGHLAQNTVFKNALERLIMVMHSEGATCREIADEIGRHRHYVEFIIKRWQTTWGIKTWSLQARGLKTK